MKGAGWSFGNGRYPPQGDKVRSSWDNAEWRDIVRNEVQRLALEGSVCIYTWSSLRDDGQILMVVEAPQLPEAAEPSSEWFLR